ncbi:MAG: hypothetical protein GWM98_12805 [Nitrospinaceae bacterium]|nr:hypothetical protein [Nitrospinaceae bacterium]NIS85622.1 hypothetical protein [Nitrospinaceae bacterium]NIT82467.1 hypothetical protein [Nitrospinaceae bacterium]NIU96839.1 hypothetical protein [Nitrospinaceae bacterium]NIY15703.1 hypothetical protein [Nitrospinaceae bacterium]
MAKKIRARVVTFGIEHRADIRARDIQPKTNDGFAVTVELFQEKFALDLPFLGYCNIYNALAALATGHSLGLSPQDMVRGLGDCRLMSQRYEILRHHSITIINDAYNANPQSMRQALETLAAYQTPGRKFFVIGDMLELGEVSRDAHLRLGRAVGEGPIDYLVTVGEWAAWAAQGAREQGMAADRVWTLTQHPEAVRVLKQHARSGDCLLFKGSRGAQMEKVLQGFTAADPL